MSDILQSGQHPDADQLSAFVEHALPAHEHAGVLAHLNVCPDCRAVVFLTLPQSEPIPEHEPATVPTPALAPQPAATRRWYSGWRLAWPIAAAFAALLITVALHHQTKTSPSTASQVAESGMPTGRASAPSVTNLRARPAPENPVTPAPKRIPAKPVVPASAASTSQANAQAAPQSALAYQNAKDLVLNGRDTTELLKVLPGAVSMAQSTAAAGRSSAGMPAPLSAPAPATAVDASQLSINTATSASAIVISGDALNALSDSAELRSAQPLPSHLSILSVATSGRRMLALDTAHTLFLSDDNGQHWMTVRPAWEGRAARVALISESLATPIAASSLRGSAVAPAQVFNGANRALSGQAAYAPVAPVAQSAPPAPPPPSAPETSYISGVVIDPLGASIAGATVTLTNIATSASTTLKTDGSGRYAGDFPAGSYRMDAFAPGFASNRRTITLAAAHPSVDNVTLAVGATTETVTVTSAAGQIQTEQSQPATAMLGAAAGSEPPAPVFVITTDSGVRWTSPDGEHWIRQ